MGRDVDLAAGEEGAEAVAAGLAAAAGSAVGVGGTMVVFEVLWPTAELVDEAAVGVGSLLMGAEVFLLGSCATRSTRASPPSLHALAS